MASSCLSSDRDQRLADLLVERAVTRVMDHKTVAVPDALVEEDGTFEALVASFDTLDSSGDVIRRGAFQDSLTRWRERGRRIPVVWSHQVRDPALVIGSADPRHARETAEGLVVKGRLNIERSAAADHVYDLLRNGDVDSWSFGYRTLRSRRLDSKRTELLELDLIEFGPTPTPANAEARTLAVKGCPLPHRRPDRPPTHAELELDLFVAGILDSPFRSRATTNRGPSRKNGPHRNPLDHSGVRGEYALRERAAHLAVFHPSYVRVLPALLEVGIIPSWLSVHAEPHRASTRLGRDGS